MLTFIACQKVGILNRTGIAQYLPAGCSVATSPGSGYDSALTPSNVPPNTYLVIPSGVQVNLLLSNGWFIFTPEWAAAIVAAGLSNLFDQSIQPPSFFPASAVTTNTFPPGSRPQSISYWPSIAVISES